MSHGKWEQVAVDTDRLQVPSGWLYRVRRMVAHFDRVWQSDVEEHVGDCVVFVPKVLSVRRVDVE